MAEYTADKPRSYSKLGQKFDAMDKRVSDIMARPKQTNISTVKTRVGGKAPITTRKKKASSSKSTVMNKR